MFGDSDFAVLWAVLILIIAGLAVLHYFLFEKPPKMPFLTSKKGGLLALPLFACWHQGGQAAARPKGRPMQPQKSQKKTLFPS